MQLNLFYLFLYVFYFKPLYVCQITQRQNLGLLMYGKVGRNFKEDAVV